MPTLIVIAGPTASGKTDLSIEVAKAFDADIFSADARQFYRKMNIGTAKPTENQLSAVPHHFIDHLDVEEDYSAGSFERDALKALNAYFDNKDYAVLVGGSGLYINAVTEGFDDLPQTPLVVRDHYNTLFEQEGLEALQKELAEKDPAYYQAVDENNRQRVQRALEAIEVTASPFSDLRKNQKKSRSFDVVKVLLNPERHELYDRINSRVDLMVKEGLIEEARSLEPFKAFNALQTVGYQELFDAFEGRWSIEDAVHKIKQHTRNYAKRQVTWFKKQEGYTAFQSNDPKAIIRHLKEQLNV